MHDNSHKEAATGFMKAVAAGQVREAYERYVGAGFKHHNPFFRGDAPSLQEAMEQNAKQHPDKVLEIQTVIAEGDRVAVFSRVRQSPKDKGGAAVHIFRFKGERIAELWDVGQEVPEASVNENGMF
jgi:predicted SnoaL-like aldol condensation-catalyzing enzyme